MAWQGSCLPALARNPFSMSTRASYLAQILTPQPEVFVRMTSDSVYDHPLSPKSHIRSGSRSHFFQPPNASSASTPLQQSRCDLRFHHDGVSSTKNRARNDSLQSSISTPQSITPGAWSSISSNFPSTTEASDVTSPASFVNTRYRLAGGLDTPSTASTSGFYDAQDTPYFIMRRGNRTNNTASPPEDYFGRMPPALDREGNGRSRAYTPQIQNEGWSQAVVAAVAGVAGKVWEFCTAGAFRGFQAGGTQGKITGATSSSPRIVQSSIWQDVSPSASTVISDPPSTSVPGGYPDPDSSPSPDRTPSRVGKRPKYDSSSSWVMVPSNITTSRETSPSRLASRKLPSLASTPSARRPASSAGLRRPILPASRPSLTFTPTNRPASSASTRSPLPSPRRASHQRTSSYTTNGISDDFAPGNAPERPLGVEAQRLAAKVRKREKEEDRALKGFNDRLKAMIKEGKEALGTKFEIEMDELEGD